MKEKSHVLSKIRARVSPLPVGRDIHYTIGSTTLDTRQLIDLQRLNAEKCPVD